MEKDPFGYPRRQASGRSSNTTSYNKSLIKGNDYKAKMFFYKDSDFKKKDRYGGYEDYDDYEDVKNFNDGLYSELFGQQRQKKAFANKSRSIVTKK
jgi:hypothetical protein